MQARKVQYILSWKSWLIEGWKKQSLPEVCCATSCCPCKRIGITELMCTKLLCTELPCTHGTSTLILQAKAKHLQIMGPFSCSHWCWAASQWSSACRCFSFMSRSMCCFLISNSTIRCAYSAIFRVCFSPVRVARISASALFSSANASWWEHFPCAFCNMEVAWVEGVETWKCGAEVEVALEEGADPKFLLSWNTRGGWSWLTGVGVLTGLAESEWVMLRVPSWSSTLL